MLIEILVSLAGALLILLVLWDAFRTVVLPRRAMGRFRLLWVFYRLIWPLWVSSVRRSSRGHHGRRELLLSIYSPLALLVQVGLWATGLIVGFGLIGWSLGPVLADPAGDGLISSLYFSGVTFLTLGFGDVYPLTPAARLLAVMEAGVGFAFLALVIGYLPMLYQAFSRREVAISLLDARAGSPPSAGELLRRCGSQDNIVTVLRTWEVWGAELLESHMSYPALGLFRSQHENQSWLSALTTILDTSALLLASNKDVPNSQARLTFAMARHAAVDLVQVYDVTPLAPDSDRLSAAEYQELRQTLQSAGLAVDSSPEVEARLNELREMYEPYINALASFLAMPLPPWTPAERDQDAWEASPYDSVHWYEVRDEQG